MNHDSGKLYLVATPIGNLEDMTYRAVRILSEVDIIAAEDTRNSIKLLNHFEIKTPMTSYHEFNRYDKAEKLIGDMLGGRSVAVITDAGTPGISDPGEVLVYMAHNAGIEVIPVPGACAAISALIASGQPTARFAFEAFLPQDKKERRERLRAVAEEVRTVVLYEAPHRLRRTLSELRDAVGGSRELTICKELTKKHEGFRRMTVGEAVSLFEEEEPRGEYVLVIKGRSREELEAARAESWNSETVEEHLERYIGSGMSKKDAVKLVAEERGIPRRDVYSAAIKL